MQVHLNVYDVPGGNDQIDSVIQRLNEWGRHAGFGGVFHGAVEIDGLEWSFGACPTGTGVYSNEPKMNPMYKFRETVALGPTNRSKQEVKRILKRLESEWRGDSYELFSRNCCHFCEALAQELQVLPVPGWLNRAAASADAAVTFSNKAYTMGSNVGTNISRTATSGYGWLCSSVTGLLQQQQQQQQQEEQADQVEGPSDSFLKHFSFTSGNSNKQKPPARAIWEGGITNGSPLHAALKHPRDPTLAGIANLPPSHSGSPATSPATVPAITAPMPQAPLDHAPALPSSHSAADYGTVRGLRRPQSAASNWSSSSKEQDQGHLPAWVPLKLAGGLQSAAAVTAAAAAAPASWLKAGLLRAEGALPYYRTPDNAAASSDDGAAGSCLQIMRELHLEEAASPVSAAHITPSAAVSGAMESSGGASSEIDNSISYKPADNGSPLLGRADGAVGQQHQLIDIEARAELSMQQDEQQCQPFEQSSCLLDLGHEQQGKNHESKQHGPLQHRQEAEAEDQPLSNVSGQVSLEPWDVLTQQQQSQLGQRQNGEDCPNAGPPSSQGALQALHEPDPFAHLVFL